ncbi:MAG TPA: heparinase II/III family protein [Stellaceae bacterium]|nr:heparinase II/III family protein [Stellaceae bacterium]
MALSAYLRRAHALPPREVARKAMGFGVRAIARRIRLVSDGLRGSYGPPTGRRNPAACIRIGAEDIAAELEATLRNLGNEYLAHRFDLLGSGWVAPAYGFRPDGFLGRRHDPAAPLAPDRDGGGLDRVVNRANRVRARQVWALIGGADYRPIDWQLDFRSGFRWPGRRHSYRQRIPVDTGADVKVPWELGRLQHLPQLALCAILAAADRLGFDPSERYRREIADQLMDFIATNPPRFGVNWMGAMDVAIRAANIALTLALLAGAGAALDPVVETVVLGSLRDHADHVAGHLDYSETGRSNHYLAGLAGLIWTNWILESGTERDRRLGIAIDQIFTEADAQFLPDGGNYEGSTGYHRLSAETVLFSVGIARTLGREIPGKLLATLRRVAALSRAVQGDDGTIVQIGDTDSGRFFKLHPTALPESFGGAASSFVENPLDHAGLVQAVEALFNAPPSGARLEAVMMARLAPPPVSQHIELKEEIADFGDLDRLEAAIAALPEAARRVRRLALPRPIEPAAWQRSAFPDFGLYVFRHEPGLLVAFRCLKGLAPSAPRGHTHDDNLGIEYRLGPLSRRDPGSFVYTPSVALRNAYRAAAAHDVPRAADWEVAPAGRELFDLAHRAFATCLAWRPDGVAGEIKAPWGRILRLIRFTPIEIVVTEIIEPARDFAPATDPEPSKGYGRL